MYIWKTLKRLNPTKEKKVKKKSPTPFIKSLLGESISPTPNRIWFVAHTVKHRAEGLSKI